MTVSPDRSELPGTLGHLERLTELAIRLSTASADRETAERRLDCASHIFTAACLVADALLRTHPESKYSSAAPRRVWNPVATAALARVLMEACVNLHYFSVEEISDDEREFRFLVADLHCVRERLHMSDSLRSERIGFESPPPTPEADDSFLAMAAKADLARESLAKQLEELRGRLRLNKHFQSLGEKDQKKWYEGNYAASGRYRGTGFALELRDRAERAGFRPSAYEAEYRHLSSYIHTAPSAMDQIAAFGPDREGMLRWVMPTEVRGCCGTLAVCIRYFISLFPETSRLVEPAMCDLIDFCSVYPTGPAQPGIPDSHPGDHARPSRDPP